MFIKSNFAVIIDAIQKLETRGLRLCAAIDVVSEVSDKLSDIKGPHGTKIKEKLSAVLTKNEGYGLLKKANKNILFI